MKIKLLKRLRRKARRDIFPAYVRSEDIYIVRKCTSSHTFTEERYSSKKEATDAVIHYRRYWTLLMLDKLKLKIINV